MCKVWYGHKFFISFMYIPKSVITATLLSVVLILAILLGMKWYLCGFGLHFPND